MALEVPEKLKRSGGYGGRHNIGKRWLRFLTEDAGLRPGDAVLDVGCGLGRIAEPLIDYLTGGRYEGFDIDAEAIAWCEENITRRAPHFHFRTVALQSRHYNPGGGKPADTFVFPYESGTFDVVFLASVFTHLLDAAVANYLKEIHRVLKPGGRVVASCFLLNAESEKAIAESAVRLDRHHFVHDFEGCRVWKTESPEAAVAHFEDRFRALYRDAGLDLTEIRYGRWVRRAKAQSNQDMVFAVRP
jgi:SAM-dependent methyltransferase